MELGVSIRGYTRFVGAVFPRRLGGTALFCLSGGLQAANVYGVPLSVPLGKRCCFGYLGGTSSRATNSSQLG